MWVALNVSSVRDHHGCIVHFIGQIEDIAARKEAEETLIRQALYDPLTGLPNRPLMLDRLRQALARSERAPGAVTLMFVDLDQFKLVNDSLGHLVGDQVLCMVAQRVLAAVRPADTVCRLGGDEFVVVCEGLMGETEATALAARVEAAISQPCLIGGEEVIVTASVGLVVGGAGPNSERFCGMPTARCTGPSKAARPVTRSSTTPCDCVRASGCGSSGDCGRLWWPAAWTSLTS